MRYTPWLCLLWQRVYLRAVEVARELRSSAASASARASDAGEQGGGSSREGPALPGEQVYTERVSGESGSGSGSGCAWAWAREHWGSGEAGEAGEAAAATVATVARVAQSGVEQAEALHVLYALYALRTVQALRGAGVRPRSVLAPSPSPAPAPASCTWGASAAVADSSSCGGSVAGGGSCCCTLRDTRLQHRRYLVRGKGRGQGQW